MLHSRVCIYSTDPSLSLPCIYLTDWMGLYDWLSTQTNFCQPSIARLSLLTSNTLRLCITWSYFPNTHNTIRHLKSHPSARLTWNKMAKNITSIIIIYSILWLHNQHHMKQKYGLGCQCLSDCKIVKNKTDVGRRQTLGHPRSINPNMINHVPQQSPLIF